MIPSLRRLRHIPGSTLAIVLTLGLGIGATTAIFTVLNGVLLEPLPIPDADRVVMLWQRAPGVGVAEDWFSPAQYFDLREQVGSFESVAIAFGLEVTLAGDGDEPERVGALGVSSSWFDVLAVRPRLGRRLAGDDDASGAPPRVLLSSGLFERRFGGDPGIIGRTIRYDGIEAEVVGVLPESLVLDADLLPTLNTVPRFDLVFAMPVQDPGVTTRGSENFNVLARLKPDATAAKLRTELLEVADGFRRDPGSLAAGLEPGSGFRIATVRLLEQVSGPARLPLLALLVATVLLLIATCANAANLLLTHATTRRHEIGIRAALGAGTREVIGRAFGHSLVLGVASGLVGLLMAGWAIAVLHAVAPPGLPRLYEVTLNAPVLLFTVLVVLGATLLFGTAPAIHAARVDPAELMRGGGVAVRARSVWRSRGSQVLVAAQVAISLVLIAGAGLLTRAFWELQTENPGFDPRSTLTYRLSLAGDDYVDPQARVRFYQRLYRDLADREGVVAAGGAALLPFTRGYAWTDFVVEGRRVVDARDRIVADLHVVTPGYFEALGARLLAGRWFDDHDDAEAGTVLVSRDFAERFWGVEQAVGKWVGRDDQKSRATIVGVVDTIRHYGLGAEPRPTVYYTHAVYPTRTMYGAVRVKSGEEEAVTDTVRRTVRRIDPELPVYDVRSMTSRVHASLLRERLLMALVAVFAAVALIVASVGLYGVLAFAVASHAHEIGVRKALGAQQLDLYRLVLGGAAVIVITGAIVGLGLVIIGGMAARGLLHGVAPSDPLVLSLALALLGAVAAAAGVIPARRATRIDPVEALRSD